MTTDRIPKMINEVERIERAARTDGRPTPDHRGRSAADLAAEEDRATRTSMAVENYLARRRILEEALNDLAVLKHTLRQLAAELEPRLQGIEGRLVVLARTVGNLLAELDRGHTTTVTRLRNATVPTDQRPTDHIDRHSETTKVDPNARTPLPGEV